MSDSCTAGLGLCFAQHKLFPERGGVPSTPNWSLRTFKGKQQRGNHYITQPFLSTEEDEVIKSEMGSVWKCLMRFPAIRLLIAAFQRSRKCNQLIWESLSTPSQSSSLLSEVKILEQHVAMLHAKRQLKPHCKAVVWYLKSCMLKVSTCNWVNSLVVQTFLIR